MGKGFPMGLYKGYKEIGKGIPNMRRVVTTSNPPLSTFTHKKKPVMELYTALPHPLRGWGRASLSSQ